jgi:hypothetical protein
MRNKTAKALRRSFQYTKTKVHGGYDTLYSGQRLKQVFGINGKNAEGQNIATSRLEPYDMHTLVCKDTDRRFYRQMKKIYSQHSAKSISEINKLLEELV